MTPRNPEATDQIWLYSALVGIVVVPAEAVRSAKIVRAVVPE
jgi:hypothetical protein